MIFYECYIPEGQSRAQFEKDIGKTTECYTGEMPGYWAQSCWNVPIVWNHGADGDMLPNHLGIPIGEEHGGLTFFLFEVHYEMPDKASCKYHLPICFLTEFLCNMNIFP